MGKAEKHNDNVPELSPQTEASKLLEQALLQMDGIISGNTNSLTTHSPDFGITTTPFGVREAANSLATIIQNSHGSLPPPDSNITKIILQWIQNEDDVRGVKYLRATTSDELEICFSEEEDDTSNCNSSNSSSDSTSTTDSERAEGLTTITEEEQNTPSITYKGLDEIDDDSSGDGKESSIKKNSTNNNINNIKSNVWLPSAVNNNGSGSDLSSTTTTTTSSEKPRSLKDSSTRCNDDFQWICKDKMGTEDNLSMTTKPPINRCNSKKGDKSAPGSLDRRRYYQNRQERDQKSRSTHIVKTPTPPPPPPRLDDFIPCQGWCCNPPPHDMCFDNFHRRHERFDPQKYGSNSMLMDQKYERNSHPDIYNDCQKRRYEQVGGCCPYHLVPPPWFYHNDQRAAYQWTYPSFFSKPVEHDEKIRKLQYEKDNLQLQVQVLSEQIEAQSDKIIDLERTLTDRKLQLSDAEDKLQREILSRSSLETQKLELMSILSELKLQQAALERENIELKSHFNHNSSLIDIKKPPLAPRTSPGQTSTSLHHMSSNQTLRLSPSPSPAIYTSSPRRCESNQETPPPKTPPANYKRQIDIHYGSLPKQQFLSNGSTLSVVDSNANPSRKGVAFGREFSTFIGERARGYSVPNLAETEKLLNESNSSNDQSQLPTTIQFNKTKGIKKIFGRLKRSGSGNLDDLPGIGEFQRGGVRATAAARLGWSEPHLIQKPDKPFSEWNTDNICDWLQDLGLDQYITEAKRWIKNGQQLQNATINEIEKELNVKNPLHKKKLQLALSETKIDDGLNDQYLSLAGKLDTSWVLRWLDDVGLPQYKETFLINRIDGRVLHLLTVDDLVLLHITSLLHVASIKRGIQVLRENNYDPNCLQRRSANDDQPPTTKEVALWTTHRVMEWLRAVDLAEYAPNLRGAGVHGGLMVYETKFTAELLASLLSIPTGKTLLRRHLNTHFKELLGKDIIQDKREAESTLGYVPLTPSAKLKIPKKSQFSLKRKKSKSEADYNDLVCPLNPDKLSGELNDSALNSCVGIVKMKNLVEDVYPGEFLHHSLPSSITNSPMQQRRV